MRHNQASCPDCSASRSVLEKDVYGCRIVFILLPAGWMFGCLLEGVLDAIHLVSQAVYSVQKRRAISLLDLKVFVVRVEQSAEVEHPKSPHWVGSQSHRKGHVA